MFPKNTIRIRSLLCTVNRCFCSNKSTDQNKTNLEIPPEPTNCCMSGCPNCVWIEYAETLSKLFKDGGDKARQIILEKINDPNMRAYLELELKNLEKMKQYEKEIAKAKDPTEESKS